MFIRLLGTTLSRQFTTSAVSQRSFTISYIIAGTRGEIQTETYSSPKFFRNTFHGYHFTNPKTGYTYTPADLVNEHKDSTVVYIAKSAFFTVRLDEYNHNQVADKAFKDRACRALEDHLQTHSVWRHDNRKPPDGRRILTGDDGRDIAEWDGIWESPNGQVYFLEGNHLLDLPKLLAIREKLERSCRCLGLENSKATVYLAGNHWSPGVIEVAQSHLFKFGVLSSNGKDLSVLDPPPA